jgi:hypothetical protein
VPASSKKYRAILGRKDNLIGLDALQPQVLRFRYTKFRSCKHRAVIRVYDVASNVIETHEHAGRVQRAASVTRVKQKAATR